MNKSLLTELAFLDKFDTDNENFLALDWIEEKPAEGIWICHFANKKFGDLVINFNSWLDDNSLLTDPSNRELLTGIQQFILMQFHPYATQGKSYGDVTKYRILTIALQLIDYFLLRSKQFELSKYGFGLVSPNCIRLLIVDIHSGCKHGLYPVVETLENFFSQLEISEEKKCWYRLNDPAILDFDETDRVLDLSDEEVINARIWLNEFGFYSFSNTNAQRKYRKKFKLSTMMNVFWNSQTLGPSRFDFDIPEFSYDPMEGRRTEYPPVQIRPGDDDEGGSMETISLYLRVLKNMSLVNYLGVPVISEEALKVLDEKPDLTDVKTKVRQRFATLPFDVSRDALEKAFIFFYEKGDVIVDGIVEILNQDLYRNLIIPERLRELNVLKYSKPKGPSLDQYFVDQRKDMYLVDLYKVLIGACVIIINTLMARRVQEIVNLVPEDIICDESEANEYFLRIDLQKMNFEELRESIYRPAPSVVKQVVELLSRVRHAVNFKNLDLDKNIFCNLWFTKAGKVHVYKGGSRFINDCLDKFCDYFELPLNHQGKRWYFRVHQLRRNFAMLFFWNYKGAIDVLQYFLGHGKPAHTYRYITESCKGKVLSKVKADTTAQKIIAERDETASLANFLSKRYSVNDFSIFTESELSRIIQELLEKGTVSIEPEFFTTPQGESYNITYKIIGD